MSLHESTEMYLETVLVLQENLEFVRAIDIVNHMHFSKPTVSVALKKLKESGYVNVDDDTKYVSLTSKGYEVASKIYDRHKVLTSFLTSIGVSEEVAAADACKIEHDISDETLKCIRNIKL